MTKAKSAYHEIPELDDLKALGFVEGQPNTIPENISPVLKSKLLKAMGEDSTGDHPNAGGQQDVMAGADDKQPKQNASKK